jgi:Uma2 family endonuclease
MVSAATKRPAGRDPTHYPVEDDMGEGILQKLIVELLRPMIERWLADRAGPTFVGANQFIYWVQYEPTRAVAPDVYVLPGVSPDVAVKAWKLWETGVVPSFALEIVSGDVAKDYEEAPRRYAELGVPELVVFDPESTASPDRVRWQVFRRHPRRGLVLDERSDGDRICSRVLGCWLRAVGAGPSLRLRLATGEAGEDLVPTEAEAERAGKEAERAGREAERAGREAERAAKEAERAAKETERRGREAERCARELAESEVERLRAELERMRLGR